MRSPANIQMQTLVTYYQTTLLTNPFSITKYKLYNYLIRQQHNLLNKNDASIKNVHHFGTGQDAKAF